MSKKFSPKKIHAGLIILCLSLAVTHTPLLGQVGQANVIRDNVEDLANVDFRTDIRVFVVMAALNGAGYSFETRDQAMSDVRSKVMERFSHLPPATFTELQLQYQTTNLWAPETTHAAYTSLALLLEGPPKFAFKEQLVKVPHGIDVIRGFEQLLPDFYLQADLESLWKEVQPRYQEELQLYRPVVNRVIRETLSYFRIPARIYFDRNIVIIPDLLAYHDIVNARNVEGVYYIVVGPAGDPEDNFIKLQHEYLHFLLDPLMEEHKELLEKSDSYLEAARKQPLFPQDLWHDYKLLVTESLIESILHRMHPEKAATEEDKSVRRLKLIQQGMILCPYFERKLAAYEADTGEEVTLPLFLTTLLTDIPESEIRKDLEDAASTQSRLEKEEKELQEKIKGQEFAREKKNALDEAGVLMAGGNYPAAIDRLNKLLAMDPGNGGAFFYLAQISAREKNWRRSRELYQKTVAAQGLEPWIYAHALVQIGRINAAEGLYPEARRNFEQVLAMEGDLRESREEAEFLLGKLPQ